MSHLMTISIFLEISIADIYGSMFTPIQYFSYVYLPRSYSRHLMIAYLYHWMICIFK